MSVFQLKPKLDLSFQLCSPRAHANPPERHKVENIREFWKSHWSNAFSQTGSPESGWESHFDRQDIVVALTIRSEVVACHLYTFYDLFEPGVRESEYFAYFKDSSIETLINRGIRRVMTLEYIGVKPNYSQNIERLSIGKLITALGTYAGFQAGADAVIGTPITTTKAPQMMDNIRSVTLEDGIQKYGYELCLKYASVNPWLPCLDHELALRADEIWRSRHVINQLKHFSHKKSAA